MRIYEINKIWQRASHYRLDRENPDEIRILPAKRSTIGLVGERLDMADALDNLFAWTSTHERAGVSSLPPEKLTRRRQHADRELIALFDKFGQLGVPVRRPPSFEPLYREGPDWWEERLYYIEELDDVYFSVFNLQVLARRIACQSMSNLDDLAISVVSDGAAQVRRNPGTFQWEAPSLWSLLCVALLNYEDPGWDFGICAAPDCDNPFVVTRSNRTMCSKRCSKRMWAQRQVSTRLA